MTLKFGRIGRSASDGGDGLTVLGHDPVERDGDEITLVGDLPASTVADQLVLRDQFLGYDLNPDEPVIPVESSEDSTVDGFYRVQSVSVDDTEGSHFANGIGSKFTAVLLKVPGWQAPLFEVICSGAVRSNTNSVVAADVAPWCAIPGSADSFWTSAAVGIDTATVSDGTVRIFGDQGETELNAGTVNYRVEAADFYEGACRLEVSRDGGATWRTATGRQISADPDTFRISNGRVRVQQVSTSAGAIRAGYFDGLSWEETDFTLGVGPNPSGDSLCAYWTAPIVAVNSSETVTVGLVYGGASTPSGAVGGTLWLTVRRGSPVIEGVWVPVNSDNSQAWAFYRTASETGANVGTYGIEANAANSAGNKYTILSPQAITQDTTGVSGIYLDSAETSFQFGFGAANVDLVSGRSFAETYFAAMNHRQSVVAR